ncbi:MAG: VWA domain-containing protein [Bdellovibrionales bacterium]|nr:VWA domain-containing protein [Bdellovibrionales bacterium]
MRRFSLIAVLLAVTACSPTASKQYLSPYVPPNKVVDANAEIFDPQADILFVVDNSQSMDTHQANLARNIGLFTSVFLKNSVLDYNIGVVSTDTERFREPCCGHLYGDVKVVTKQTPDANYVLGRNIQIGTNGSGYERLFDPIFLALSSPLVDTYNRGFLRPSASLIVIFITDAEDQSERMSAKGLYDFLVNLKGGDKRKVLGYGAIIPSGFYGCTRDPSNDGGAAPEPKRIEDFLQLTDPGHKNILNLCAGDFGTRLAEFATDIVNQVGSIVYLSRAPILQSIRVVYGAAELPMDAESGWSFDPTINAVRLGRKIDWSSQPNGSRVQVFYDAARFDEE